MAGRTVRDLIAHAFASVGVGRVGQSLDDRSSAFGLDTFNEMLDAWRSEGIRHGHNELTQNDVIYSGALSSAFRKNLAILIAESYGVPIPPLLLRTALSEKARLMAFDDKSTFDVALRQRTNGVWRE